MSLQGLNIEREGCIPGSKATNNLARSSLRLHLAILSIQYFVHASFFILILLVLYTVNVYLNVDCFVLYVVYI